MTGVVELADELFGVLIGAEPLTATMLGVPGYDDRLSDFTEDGERAVGERLADLAQRARALDPDALSADDRTTRAVIIQQAEATMDRIECRLVEYTVASSFLAPVGEVLSVLPTASVSSQDQAEAYLTRLRAVPAFLDAIAARHRMGIAAGRVPVARLVRAAIEQLDAYAASPDQDPFLRPEPAEGNENFVADRERVLAELVRPALAGYREVLATEVLPHGRPDDRPGLSWLPEGEQVYAALSRLHTTTDRTPDELHETGLRLVADLAREYIALGTKTMGTDDLQQIFANLRTDPALRWNTEDELLDAAREAISRASKAAPSWFGLRPSHECQVEAVPAVEAAGSPGAYYMPASMDGERRGTYFANTDKVTERFRYTAEATAFHEAVPGHHFQFTISQELPDLPLLRRTAPVTSYIEGWGLYTERLAEEMGLYSGDVARFGMLTLDSMRAARLVVDTGLHAKGWSRQQAIDFMRDNTAMAPMEIESEVDRYVAAPGQALAYMVGRLEIQRLRAEAEQALGERFDIRAFHDLVLAGGPLPLSTLAEVVTDWIAAQV
ncbi:DUF885 domain-containing protein [Solihabitans fulvus]|uniref:DUF885 domain-containing protein n=1 Tax=Solihabitans fulvus TaxID=1892852 RepID=A0A5B2XJ57_9PSEU|nr:DUF885 domain-containing protein [Solihabitans fulvus]KAA2263264.1 DUF885 domain-containing protein [Solihabitans fulvus]